MPSPEQTVWWQVYPLGFVGAPIRDRTDGGAVVHRLGHLMSWLDYAVDLGATGLALGPVFASETHGYDTVDYYRIDPRLGDDTDFDELIAAAHARGMRVLADGVFNHVGRAHPAYQDVLANGPGSRYAPWFHLQPASDWQPGRDLGARTFEGHGGLIELNHACPDVVEAVSSVLRYWLGRGVNDWRLDAAYAVPAWFWAQVLPGVRRDFQDAWFVGEVIHGDYVAYVENSGLDSVTQYELWKALWSSLVDRNLFELSHALDRHNTFVEHFAPLTFAGNHDVTRLISQVGGDDRLAGIAVIVLATVGGVPSIYYGDEQAFRGMKEDGWSGDDEVRPAFPPTPSDLLPEGWRTYRLYQELLALRAKYPWLTHARTTKVDLTNTRFRYVSRDPGGTGELAVDIRLEPQPAATISSEQRLVFAYP